MIFEGRYRGKQGSPPFSSITSFKNPLLDPLVAPFGTLLGTLWAPFGRFGEPLGSIVALWGASWSPFGLFGIVVGRPEGKKGVPKGSWFDFHVIFKHLVVCSSLLLFACVLFLS